MYMKVFRIYKIQIQMFIHGAAKVAKSFNNLFIILFCLKLAIMLTTFWECEIHLIFVSFTSKFIIIATETNAGRSI